MDRGSLEQMLGQGLSLAEIGKRFGRHEATVSYWLKKHGLEAAHRCKHVAKGGIPRDTLERLVEADLSIAQIAQASGCSKATVRHWLTRYGLKTHGALERRAGVDVTRAKRDGRNVVALECRHHGMTDFVLDQRGYYKCKQCRSASVSRRRRRVKELLVAEAGGACCVCGYDRNVRALHFHHLDPSLKRIEINARGAAVALEHLRVEARKCVLVCANCHAEVEAGLIVLPHSSTDPYNAAGPAMPG
jgi:transposase